MYYGFDITKEKRYKYTEMSKIYQCSPNNIRESVLGMRRALLRVEVEALKKFEEVV